MYIYVYIYICVYIYMYVNPYHVLALAVSIQINHKTKLALYMSYLFVLILEICFSVNLYMIYIYFFAVINVKCYALIVFYYRNLFSATVSLLILKDKEIFLQEKIFPGWLGDRVFPRRFAKFCRKSWLLLKTIWQ